MHRFPSHLLAGYSNFMAGLYAREENHYKSLALKGGGEEGTMRRIDTTATSSTFFDRIDPQTIGFLTLFHDGTLTLSSHDASNGTTAATASSGICKKAAD